MKQNTVNNKSYSGKLKIPGHFLALAGLLILTRVFLVPYLESFERLPGESAIADVRLPRETGNIRFVFDDFKTDGQTAVEVIGWAFIDDQDAVGQETHIILDSKSGTYVFDTEMRRKPDVTEHFKEMDLDLDLSGFRALIPVRMIRNGEYRVGIYIRKGEIEALTYTPRRIVKSQGLIHKQAE